MKKLTNTRFSAGSFNVAMLVMRLGFGLVMITHGYDKLQHFDEYKNTFMNFLGFGKSVSLGLIIFAELGCAALLVLGLFTRFACVVLIIGMLVAVSVSNWDFFHKAEVASLYVIGYLALLFAGPGRYSADGYIFK